MQSDGPPRRAIVIAEAPADGTALAEAFHRAGVTLGRRSGLPVGVARNPLAAELARINARMLRRGTPWMLVKAGGSPSWVGPLFIPGSTACWQCLAHRLLENRWEDESSRTPSAAFWKRVVEAAVEWMETATSVLLGRILPQNPAGAAHTLTKRPQCSACGQPALCPSVPIRLQGQPKSDGQHACAVGETLQRLSKWDSDITGIVSPVPKRAPWQTLATCLATHCRPLGAGLMGAARHPIAGKGATAADARASCLAEAMERYSIDRKSTRL